MPELYSTEHEREAYRMGADAGVAAASWVIDGPPLPGVVKLLAMLDAGDPEAHDYLPARPDLSGEWADSPTPASLYADIVGENLQDAMIDAGLASETLVGSVADAICDAWEAGVESTFESECERILRAALPDETEGN